MLWPSPPLSMHRLLSLVEPPPLSPRRRHYRRANACLAPAVGCCIVTSLAAPVPLLLCRRLSRCLTASLVAPHLRRLVVASPTILTCRCLSCRAGWLLPCYLSLCAAVSLFATSLIAPQSLCVIDPLNPSKKRIGLLGGSSSIIRRSGTGRKASCGALEGNFRRRRPWWLCLFLAVGSRQHISTFGIVHVFYRIKMFLVYFII